MISECYTRGIKTTHKEFNMSTRAYVGMVSGKSIKAVYVNFDGYVTGVGDTLKTHYANPLKIKEMISLGDMSSLSENVNPTKLTHSYDEPENGVNVYYGRDRGEIDTAFKRHISESAFLKAAVKLWCEYAYLFDGSSWKTVVL